MRTLVSVPPLPDTVESSGDVPEAETPVAAFAPLAAVGEPELADDDAASGSDDEDDAVGGAAPVLTVVEGSGNETGASSDDRTWVEPLEDGGCPPGYPIKANDNSGIYHVLGGRSYSRTVADRCYASAEAAEADGYRAAKA